MRLILFICLLTCTKIVAQDSIPFVDDRYLEDQLYVKVGYNHLTNTPKQISQSGFSYGLGLGFIKDLPLNTNRNVGLGIGLGYSLNNYFFNVRETPNSDDEILKSNKVTLHSLDVPLELRFRTSKANSFKFWRLYPGFMFSYAFAKNTNLKQDNNINVEDIIDLSRVNYGLTLSGGYNKWNFHIYYGLNPLFSQSKINSFKFDLHDLRLGLIFYIL